MSDSKLYFVYLMTNKNNTVIYTGITNNLNEEYMNTKKKLLRVLPKRYNVNKLVYYEATNDINLAI
jgi:putative endonuclease